MDDKLKYRDRAVKHHTVSVPKGIKIAKVEILTFRGAPAFVGTKLARLHYEDKSIILYSKMSGVVNRILVENDQNVCSEETLFELRNINIIRDKSGRKNQPKKLPSLKLSLRFFKNKRNDEAELTHSLSQIAPFKRTLKR